MWGDTMRKLGIGVIVCALAVLVSAGPGCSKKDKKDDFFFGIGGGGINLTYSYRWTVDGDASLAQLEAIAGNIQVLSNNLYLIGEGQQYIKSITLADQASDGRIRTIMAGIDSYFYDPGVIYAANIPDGSGGYVILVGGLVDPYTFAHEHGHNTWYLPGNFTDLAGREEYNDGGCACVMSTMAAGGAMQYCDSSVHTITKYDDCWTGIKDKCSMKHTTGSFPDPGSCPTATNVTITDN